MRKQGFFIFDTYFSSEEKIMSAVINTIKSRLKLPQFVANAVSENNSKNLIVDHKHYKLPPGFPHLKEFNLDKEILEELEHVPREMPQSSLRNFRKFSKSHLDQQKIWNSIPGVHQYFGSDPISEVIVPGDEKRAYFGKNLDPPEKKFANPFSITGDGEGCQGAVFQHDLGGNRRKEQFTIVMLTYDRNEILINSLKRLDSLPFLNKVIVVWNNEKHPDEFGIPKDDDDLDHLDDQGHHFDDENETENHNFNENDDENPENNSNKEENNDDVNNKNKKVPLRWPDIGVEIVVIKTQKNSLNNRFYPYPEIETDAVLHLDDDVHLRQDEILFAFRIWREEPESIIGFPGRFHGIDPLNSNKWNYNSNYTCELSMILTGAAFVHKHYMNLYHFYMHEDIRNLVDEYVNCEDIALNYLVSHITRKPPIKVTSRWTFRCPNCPSALSSDDSHFEERHKCMNVFTEIYGYNPLLLTQRRSDSVLFKTRIPTGMSKCFKFI